MAIAAEMFATLDRPYKERSPEDTVQVIRGILARHGLEPIETFSANPFPQVHSVSLELTAERGGFRANGKGRTREYCLASAYAEFVERLQNGLYANLSRILLERLREEYGFSYAPDESLLSQDEFLALPEIVVADLVRYKGAVRDVFINAYFDRLRARDSRGAVAVPFLNSSSWTTTLLPLNLLLMAVGSNGMAAGNSREEALFQAMCELLERWGAAEVYYRELTPPTIPVDHLREHCNQEYEVIRGIEKSGKYRIVVKDFSAGRGIPAVGVLVENTDQGRYRLNVASDTCLQVALSRSLTEVFQGFTDEEMIDRSLLPIPTESPPCFASRDSEATLARYMNFQQFTKDNTGVFPTSLFAAASDYSFDRAVFSPRKSYQDEVDRLLAFFHGQGYSVYIRDVSFLGFPSVFVYVPEVSAQGRKNAPGRLDERPFDLIELDKAQDRLYSIRRASREEFIETAGRLQALPPHASLTGLLGLKLREGVPWAQMDVSFLLAQLWHKSGRPAEAHQAFRSFLQGRSDDIEYYRVLERYLALLASGRTASECREELSASIGNAEVVRDVCDHLADSDRVFDRVRLPECPDCLACALREHCVTTHQLDLARTLYPIMKDSMPCQAGLMAGTSGIPSSG